ncbi:hypothetical protein [Thiobacillus denitrificans]|uniref:hypothetical protein n=1 Tax=Thiobacillus denitrificans TaxID=36861 RepID=UPI00037323C2|nr:hypothetical protein [Thiobacillus denitrificans]
MMKAILIPLILILAGCDPTPPPHPETGRTLSPAFETQVQALEKARAVEARLMDAAAAQRAQTEGAAPP